MLLDLQKANENRYPRERERERVGGKERERAQYAHCSKPPFIYKEFQDIDNTPSHPYFGWEKNPVCI